MYLRILRALNASGEFSGEDGDDVVDTIRSVSGHDTGEVTNPSIPKGREDE